eukprot:6582458-Heterocapsa_arctica.AAC.1
MPRIAVMPASLLYLCNAPPVLRWLPPVQYLATTVEAMDWRLARAFRVHQVRFADLSMTYQQWQQ